VTSVIFVPVFVFADLSFGSLASNRYSENMKGNRPQRSVGLPESSRRTAPFLSTVPVGPGIGSAQKTQRTRPAHCLRKDGLTRGTTSLRRTCS